jgi:hypothetical protein
MSAELKRMAAAHAKVAETRAALSAATKAEAAAQTLRDNIEKELAKHLRRNQERASERAAKLMASLKLGSAPALKKSVGLAADHVALMEARHRRDAAMIAVDQLGTELSAATAAHTAAKEAVAVEARAILAREAEQHAERIAVLEGEAFEHRVKLEGASRSGAFGYRPISLNDLSKKILIENNSLPFGVRNTEPWVAANASAENWRQRLNQLLKSDPAQ